MSALTGICEKCHAYVEFDESALHELLFMCHPCAETFRAKIDARNARLAARFRNNPIALLATALNRARRANLPATMTLEEMKAATAHFSGLCAYCAKREAHLLEHATPISRGGGTTDDNCLPSCLRCNMTKGRHTIEEILYELTPALAYLHARGRPTALWEAEAPRLAREAEWRKVFERLPLLQLQK